MQIRRQRGEAPFGYLKMFGGLRRFAGRGLAYASKKTLIAAAGWNLLRLVKTIERARLLDAPVSGIIALVMVIWNSLGWLANPISPPKGQPLYSG